MLEIVESAGEDAVCRGAEGELIGDIGLGADTYGLGAGVPRSDTVQQETPEGVAGPD